MLGQSSSGPETSNLVSNRPFQNTGSKEPFEEKQKECF